MISTLGSAKCLLFIHIVKIVMAVLVPVIISIMSLGGAFEFSALLSTVQEINKVCLENSGPDLCSYIFYSPLLVSFSLVLVALLFLFDKARFRMMLIVCCAIYLVNWLALLFLGRDFLLFSMDGVAVFMAHILFLYPFFRESKVKGESK